MTKADDIGGCIEILKKSVISLIQVLKQMIRTSDYEPLLQEAEAKIRNRVRVIIYGWWVIKVTCVKHKSEQELKVTLEELQMKSVSYENTFKEWQAQASQRIEVRLLVY